ncbi:MAG: hypothetical protein IPH80_24220 [Myxococcales bacterium]|nr:hypothetical protein [Myxococcales bacterium]
MAGLAITLATEGADDLVVARRLVELAGHTVAPGPGEHQGHGMLDAALPGYCRVAEHMPWLVLRDLDTEVCAPALIERLAPHRPPRMLLRVAVRAIESWFFADPETLAAFLGVAANKVPRDPDAEPWPKRAMVELARRSRRRDVKLDMVPAEGAKRYYGPAYTARMIEYASDHWRPSVARARSKSLARTIAALDGLAMSRG